MLPIVIDNLIFSWQKSGGISVVWHELIKRMLRDGKDVRFLEYDGADGNSFRKRLNIPASAIKKLSTFLLRIKRYLPVGAGNIAASKPFIFHSTYYRTCRHRAAINILTVHDFTYELFQTGLTRWVHCLSKHYAIRHADCVICISENTRRDLLKFVSGVNEKKLRVVYNGVGEAFRPLADTERYDGANGYLLFVGGRNGYKNFNIAVETAKLANKKLIIVGRKLSAEEAEKVSSILGKNYADLGFVDDEKLNALYNKAFALIYPSSYEGFGIPVIEAQKAGCPVIAMNRSSIPEIIGNKEMLADADSPEEFTKKLSLLNDKTFRERIISEGLENAKRFSWESTYEQYLKIYNEYTDA